MVDDSNRKFTPPGNISDELLSAYLDGEVTPEERTLVERTVASSSEVAWRLDALRQTVALMGQLPRVPLPRSFTLGEADIRPTPRVGHDAPRWWHALLNPVFLRNATAVATMLFLVVLVGNVMLSSLAPAAPAPASATVVVQAPAVAADMSAPEIAPAAATVVEVAKIVPAIEPAALGAGEPAAEPSPMPEAALESAAALPAEPTDSPAAMLAPTPAVEGQVQGLAEATRAPPAAAEDTARVAAETGVVTETARAPAVTTLAESAPAVEITGAEADVPAPGAAPARELQTTRRSWLDVAAVILGGLALGLFVAWQLRLRTVGGSR
jgi:hypothetical protein